LKALLRDLGPKNAAEIKDELSELVIPEKEWSKWWQNARARLKKDTMIQCPDTLKEPYKLRKTELSQENLMQEAMQEFATVDKMIHSSYTFVRDLPPIKGKSDLKNSVKEKMIALLSDQGLTVAQ